MVVWRQPKEQGNGIPWAGVWKWNTIAKGTKEVWAHRRSKAPLLGSAGAGEADCHRNLFP